MGSGASKETPAPTSTTSTTETPTPTTAHTREKADVIRVPTGEEMHDTFSTTSPTGKPAKQDAEMNDGGETKNVSATEDYRSRPKLEWNPSIDSDLEHDTDDIKALQGELDQVLEGHSRIVTNRGYEKKSNSVFQPPKTDWRLPDELLEQERSLISVYNSQHSGMDRNQSGQLKTVSSDPHDAEFDSTGIVNGHRGKLRSEDRTTEEFDNASPRKNGFDPSKFREANATQPKNEIYRETTYSDYKLDKGQEEVTNSQGVSVTNWRRHPLSAKSKRSLGFHYDSSEEQLISEIEHQFTL